MRISDHITYREATRSQTAERMGIDNTPDAAALARMADVADACFEPLRQHFGVPIGVSSFYRSPTLNAAIGGSRSSDHCLGAAIDLDAIPGTGVTNSALFWWLRQHVSFDQLIWEFGDDTEPAWVHVSYRAMANRGQVLRARREAGATRYEVLS